MELKLRPMSEAPDDEMLLVKHRNPSGTTEWHTLEVGPAEPAVGFWRLADVLAAVDAMRQITPEGCEFSMAICKYPAATRPVVEVTFHRTVEVRYDAEADQRQPRDGDWIMQTMTLDAKVGWALYDRNIHCDNPRFCARRVEVKR